MGGMIRLTFPETAKGSNHTTEASDEWKQEKSRKHCSSYRVMDDLHLDRIHLYVIGGVVEVAMSEVVCQAAALDKLIPVRRQVDSTVPGADLWELNTIPDFTLLLPLNIRETWKREEHSLKTSFSVLDEDGLRKICSLCNGPSGDLKGHRAESLSGEEITSMLALDEPCGVYTLPCAQGLRCIPLLGEQSPLQALLQGRGVCKNIKSTFTDIPPPTDNQPSTTDNNEKGPCRKLLNTVLQSIELTIIHSIQDIYIPNCDRQGSFRRKQVSLTRSPPVKECKSQEAGLLLTSYDCTLIVKQISSEEVEDMHNILSEYHQHIVTCHGSTLLPQFLGMYRVTVDNEDTYTLVMRNMFSHRLTVHRKYDLKGSLVSREASDKEKVKELPTFKDVDFRNNMQRVYISEEEKEKLLDKLNRDVEFLVRLRIMDYSLLLGIHDVGRAEQEEEVEMKDSLSEEEEDSENDQCLTAVGSFGSSPEGIAGYMSSYKPLGPGEFDPYVDVYAIQSAVGAPHREVYFMGLIDILTHYDTKKKAAHAAKTVKHGAGAEISTVHPEQYAKRFREFIANIFAY
ncbi:unnamed protein product [Leuciscus chuanchicus]